MTESEEEHFKYYGVAVGRKPGVYTNWGHTHKHVNRFPGNAYKGCHDIKACVEFMRNNTDISEADIMVYDQRARGTV